MILYRCERDTKRQILATCVYYTCNIVFEKFEVTRETEKCYFIYDGLTTRRIKKKSKRERYFKNKSQALFDFLSRAQGQKAILTKSLDIAEDYIKLANKMLDEEINQFGGKNEQ